MHIVPAVKRESQGLVLLYVRLKLSDCVRWGEKWDSGRVCVPRAEDQTTHHGPLDDKTSKSPQTRAASILYVLFRWSDA